jgi:two-component system phosphate regulon response regulator PhoB
MSTRKTILVVDDERDLVELVAYNLERAGYEPVKAHTGRQALELAAQRKPDLVLLDIMLPEQSGTEVASRLRTNPATSDVPIVMVTAKTEELDQIVGLTVGADDYVTKPFSMKVLLARIAAVLRRTQGAPAAITDQRTVRLGPIEVNTETHQATLSGEPLKLTLTEFRILTSLLVARGRVLTRQVLMSRAMGPGVTVTERTIDVHVTSIRKKLGDDAPIIKTVRGVGYRAAIEPDDVGEQNGEAWATVG